MKKNINLILILLVSSILFLTGSCTKDEIISNPNGLLSAIKSGGEIVEKISYNKENLVDEVNSRYFYRKFYYNDNLQLIREDVSVSFDILSSAMPVQTREFIDPDKTGITYYQTYEYNNAGYLVKQLNYFRTDGTYELRSSRTFEYNEKDLIARALLHDKNGAVTQLYTFTYDKSGNVIEENYYSYMLVGEGNPPNHIIKNIFEYDSFNNPFYIFRQTASPGIYTNPNNIVKIKSYNYSAAPGVQSYTESNSVFEYNHQTRYPVRIKDGEEYIY